MKVECQVGEKIPERRGLLLLPKQKPSPRTMYPLHCRILTNRGTLPSMSTCELLSEGSVVTPSVVTSRKRKALTPLLIGTLLLIVGAGNVWVAEGKTQYYESAFWRSTNQVPSRPGVRGPKEFPSKVSEFDSLAARRAHSRVEYYGMVAKFGYFLIGIGSITAFFSLTRLLLRRNEKSSVLSREYVQDTCSHNLPH